MTLTIDDISGTYDYYWYRKGPEFAWELMELHGRSVTFMGSESIGHLEELKDFQFLMVLSADDTGVTE